jgi:hypothetical protein
VASGSPLAGGTCLLSFTKFSQHFLPLDGGGKVGVRKENIKTKRYHPHPNPPPSEGEGMTGGPTFLPFPRREVIEGRVRNRDITPTFFLPHPRHKPAGSSTGGGKTWTESNKSVELRVKSRK